MTASEISRNLLHNFDNISKCKPTHYRRRIQNSREGISTAIPFCFNTVTYNDLLIVLNSLGNFATGYQLLKHWCKVEHKLTHNDEMSSIDYNSTSSKKKLQIKKQFPFDETYI